MKGEGTSRQCLKMMSERAEDKDGGFRIKDFFLRRKELKMRGKE